MVAADEVPEGRPPTAYMIVVVALNEKTVEIRVLWLTPATEVVVLACRVASTVTDVVDSEWKA